MQSCVTCGMPFEGNHEGDIGMTIAEGPVCVHDCENGKLKSPEGIFDGGVAFFAMYTNGDKALAERLCRKNMNYLPYWTAHHFAELDGEQVTNEEYHTILAKL